MLTIWKLNIKKEESKEIFSRQKAILHKRLFSATLPNKILTVESIFTYFQ